MSPISLNLRSLVFAAALSAFSVPAFASVGNIVFLGDSITQGGGTANELSYRYSLWKCFVDNNEEWKPQGSMTIFNNGNTANTTLTPNYLGQTFDNRNEGHYGWDAAWFGDGSGGKNRANTWQVSGGLKDWMNTYSATPNTATVLIGVNDLSRGTYTNAEVISNVKNIVTTLQSKNPEMTVHVFSLLPSAQAGWPNVPGKTPSEEILKYNSDLEVAVKEWSTGTSVVTYHDITQGFDAKKNIHTGDDLHPNKQGALIVGGNIARALGIGQRTVGLARRSSSELSSKMEFSYDETTGISGKISDSENKIEMNNTKSDWSVSESGSLIISTVAASSDVRYIYSNAENAHEFTLSLDVKMKNTSYITNYLGILCGNGESVGALYISESGIFWGTTSNVLYRNYDQEKLFAGGDFSTLRIVWREADSNAGIDAGYYVWLGDQLIGEALNGLTGTDLVSKYKNTILIGDIGADFTTHAEVANIAFDANKAWAPTSAIPEPSAFGLLAGIGALALVAARRRRNK